jgi:hypothetical protein
LFFLLAANYFTDAIKNFDVILISERLRSGKNVNEIAGFLKVESFEAVVNQFLYAIPNTTISYRMKGEHRELHNCGIPPSNSLNLFRSVDDPHLPWPGVFFGLTISATWYWCTDQVTCFRILLTAVCL